MKEWIAIILTVITLVGGATYMVGVQDAEIEANKIELTDCIKSIEKVSTDFSKYKENHAEYHAQHDSKILDLLQDIKVETSTTRVKVEYIDEDVKLMKRGLKF